MKKKKIDLEHWDRREHFEFFSQFDEPFFGVVVEIDCENAYQTAKQNGDSFFAYYLHKSLQAVNETDEFKLRVENGCVVQFSEVHASSTIGREDGTFGFAFFEYKECFRDFQQELKLEIEKVKSQLGLRFDDNAKRIDTIHYSTFPWQKFTGLTHARNFKYQDSVPKLTFGGTFKDANRMKMNLSINAHHGLLDGFHVAKFLECFQSLLNE